MMRVTLFILTLALALPVGAADGLASLESRFDVPETHERLLAALEEGGMQVFGAVDHAQAAHEADLDLPPTRLVIFGNPKAGTRLMQCERSAAIDLPMKMLIWEQDGVTRIGYNTPAYLRSRHQLKGCDGLLEKIGQALERLAGQAAGR